MSWKLIQTNVIIYSNQNLATNEYPNIFVSKKLTRTNIWIYSYPKNDTNEYPNKYSDQKYSNIRIYSSHSAPNDPKTFHRGKSHQQKVFWPFLGPIINPWKSQSDHFLLVKSFFLGEKIPSTPRLPGNAKNTTEWVGNTQNTSRYGEEIGVPF